MIQCDVTSYFRGGQPAKTIQVFRAKDVEHAKRLALLDCQAKGWNIKLLDEQTVTGVQNV